MVLIQVISGIIGGGREKVNLELHNSFLNLGIDAYIIDTLKKTKIEDTKNIQNFTHKTEKKEILNFIKEKKPDLVLAHSPNAQRIFKYNYSNNVFFIIHNTLSKKKQKNIFKRFEHKIYIKKLFYNKNIITVSKGVKKDLIKYYNIKSKSINTIYNPFNIKNIEKQATQTVKDLPKKEYLINVSSFSYQKRHDILLKAFSKIDNKDYDLVLLGVGELEEKIKNLADKLNIANRIHFLGWKNNPYPYIKNAKLFVLSSDVEGLPTVLIESLILKTPVVSTNCPSGPSEILIDDLSNYLVEVNNINALAKKIEEALTSYPKIENKHIERFEDKKIANEYISLIEKEK